MRADTFIVDSTQDVADAAPGDGLCATAASLCTLRAAIQEANATAAVDFIEVPSGTYSIHIGGRGEDNAATGDLDITTDMTIEGTGPGVVTINGGMVDRVFDVHAPAIVTLRGMMIQNGNPDSAGGGIRTSGTLLVENTTVRTSIATQAAGGGIANLEGGNLTLVNVTLSANNADGGQGGGLANIGLGTVSMTNCTIALNAAISGGGIRNQGEVRVVNSILGANSLGGNCAGIPVISLGHNIDTSVSCFLSDPSDLQNTDPKIGPLVYNGGFSNTHALLAGSPAIDAGSNTFCPMTDQRGLPRPDDGNGDGNAVCDIGAFEVQAPRSPTATRTISPTPTATMPSPTPTNSATATPTFFTATPTNTASATPTPTSTATSPPTLTPSLTPTDTASLTPTRSATPTLSSTVSPTDTAVPSATATQTATLTVTVTASVTATPSLSPTQVPSASPPPATATPTLTITPLVTATPSRSPTPSASPPPASATRTPTVSPEPATPTLTQTVRPSASPTPTLSSTPTRSSTPSPSASATETPTRTSPPLPTLTATPTFTGIASPTATPTVVPQRPEIVLSNANAFPGQIVALSAQLQTHGAIVGGVQVDFSFDSLNIPVAPLPTGAPDCNINPALGKQGVFVFRPFGCTGMTCSTVRAAIIPVSPVTPIADGSTLFTCRFHVASFAPPITYPVHVGTIVLSDLSGVTIPGATASDGAITVSDAPTPTFTATLTPLPSLTPFPSDTPTPPPTATASASPTPRPCTGDCRGDGAVTIEEVILLVRIALDESPISVCTNGDANGDGTITIDEIIIAVNNALSGCPASAL